MQGRWSQWSGVPEAPLCSVKARVCGFTTATGFLMKQDILSSHGAIQVVKLYDLQIYEAQVENKAISGKGDGSSMVQLKPAWVRAIGMWQFSSVLFTWILMIWEFSYAKRLLIVPQAFQEDWVLDAFLSIRILLSTLMYSCLCDQVSDVP